MKTRLIFILAISACLPSLAHAGAYKCKQPNGAVAFQDHPCADGAAGGEVTLPKAQGYAAKDARNSMGGSSKPFQPDPRYPYAKEGDVEELKRQNAELQAMNKKMKEENPNWRQSQTLSRMNERAEALNKDIEGK